MDEFPRNRNQPNGRGAYCRRCHSVNSRRVHLQRKYGLTVEDFDRMMAEQNGLCAICLEAPAVHVDHDHETGKVRGLLCFNCNGALGQFRDRADLMSRAALYLTAGATAPTDFASFGFAFAPFFDDPETRCPEGVSVDGLFDDLRTSDPADLGGEVEPV